MKTLTRKQLESRQAQAVRFARDVREDDDLADEIEDESLDEYAERRRIKLQNPTERTNMTVQTRRELLDRIKELESENEDLQSRLDDISDIVGTGDRDEEEEDDDQGE